MKRFTLLLLFGGAFIAGCLPSVTVFEVYDDRPSQYFGNVYYDRLQKKPKDHPITIFDHGYAGKCPYKKVALIGVHQSVFAKKEAVWSVLKKQARKFGGDGVIIVNKTSTIIGASEYEQGKSLLDVVGEVIRFPLGIDCEQHLLIESGKGNIDSLKILLDMGFNINAKNKNNETALMIATKAGHSNVVDLLISKGANMLLRNKNQETALMMAAKADNFHIAKSLVSSGTKLIPGGARVNAISSDSTTALMEAVKVGNAEIVQLLVDAGANPYIKDIKGWTALRYAKENNFNKIIAILSKQEQKISNEKTIFEKAKKTKSIDEMLNFLALLTKYR